MKLLPWTLAFLCIVGCVDTRASVLDERLSDGRRIRELLTATKPTVLLVYSPGDCFACNNSLPGWKGLENAGKVEMVLVLASPPTERDSRSLVIQRLKAAGVLANPIGADGSSPREYVVENGAVVASAIGMAKTGRNSELLRFAEQMFDTGGHRTGR